MNRREQLAASKAHREEMLAALKAGQSRSPWALKRDRFKVRVVAELRAFRSRATRLARSEHTLINLAAPPDDEEALSQMQMVQSFWTTIAVEMLITCITTPVDQVWSRFPEPTASVLPDPPPSPRLTTRTRRQDALGGGRRTTTPTDDPVPEFTLGSVSIIGAFTQGVIAAGTAIASITVCTWWFRWGNNRRRGKWTLKRLLHELREIKRKGLRKTVAGWCTLWRLSAWHLATVVGRNLRKSRASGVDDEEEEEEDRRSRVSRLLPAPWRRAKVGSGPAGPRSRAAPHEGGPVVGVAVGPPRPPPTALELARATFHAASAWDPDAVTDSNPATPGRMANSECDPDAVTDSEPPSSAGSTPTWVGDTKWITAPCVLRKHQPNGTIRTWITTCIAGPARTNKRE